MFDNLISEKRLLCKLILSVLYIYKNIVESYRDRNYKISYRNFYKFKFPLVFISIYSKAILS